ncbi:MAG: nitrous oxide reductase family maturation protein NosD [Candidatus Hodarchaeota archaeon]
MKRRKELFLITLIALFVLSSVISINLNSDLKSNDKNLKHNVINEIDEFKGPNKSWFNNSMDPIFIDNTASNNWIWASGQPWCSGEGSRGNPYIIENITIDGGGSGNGITIKKSKNVYFEINNCTIYNTESAIRLDDTTNGKIINNNFSLNKNGIILGQSNNNTISGNTIKNNDFGILLYTSNYNNNISGNTVNNNNYGISLYFQSDNNTISRNTANNNIYGIYLLISNNNTISGNILVGNVFFIEDDGGIENTIENNNRCYTEILPSGINELKIEPYGVNDIDVNLIIALNNDTEVLFSAFNENKIKNAPLNDGLIFMNLKLNESDNLNQTIDAPINITLKYDFDKYEAIEAFWFNDSANSNQEAWEKIPFIDLGKSKIIISLNHTSLFAITGKLKSFPSSISNGDDLDDITIFIFIILAVLICSLTIITAYSTYYYKTRSQIRAKPTKKEALMRTSLVKSYDEKIVKSQNLNEYVENKNLLRIEKEQFGGNIDLFNKFELTSISDDLLKKINEIDWKNEREKEPFIHELLALTPEERDEIVDYMLKKSKSKNIQDSDKFNLEKISVRTSNNIIDNIVHNQLLYQLYEKEQFESNIDLFKKFELTSISDDILKKIDEIDWENDNEKESFIHELLALTPEERDEIVDYMLKKSKNNNYS